MVNSKYSIIQWNCNGFYGHIEEFKLLINKYNSCAFCIQETKFSFDHIPSIKNHKVFYKSKYSETACGGVAIFVKDSFSCEEYKIQTNLQAVAIKIFYPIKFILCNIYLPGSNFVSQNEIENIIQQFDSPFMLVGDFNCHNYIWGSNRVDRRGRIVEDIVDNNNLIILNSQEPTHFSLAYKTFSSIDLTIISPQLETYFEWFVDKDLHSSDHFPIIIPTISTDFNSNTRKKFLTSKADWTKFELNINLKANRIFENIDEYEEFITSRIISAAEKSIPISSPNAKHKMVPWWNPEIKSAIQERKRFLRKFKQTLDTNDFKNFIKSRFNARKIIRDAKKKSWEEFISSITINTPASVIFKKIKSINGRTQFHDITGITNENNELISSKTLICETIAKSFQKVSSSTNYSDSFLTYKNLIEATPISYPVDDNAAYNCIISMSELVNAIKDCKGSSAGPDLIHYDMIKNIPSSELIHLLAFYNKIFLSDTFPNNWKKALLIPILKKNKDAKLTDSYRPISLTNCLCKILERILNKRLQWYLETKDKLSLFQSGFRKNRSTMDNLAYLESEITEAFATSQFLIAVFFDIQKAYDTVWKRKIINEVIKIGLQGHLVKFIENFMSNRTFILCIGNNFSTEKTLENGIPQGSVLSVTLFLIVINTILESLKTPIKTALYCDDLAVFILSRNLQKCKEDLQYALTKLSEWSDTSGLTFSTSKTVAMLFTRKTKPIAAPDLYIKNILIKYVDKHKFLGLTLDKKLNWKDHIYEVKAKATKALNLLKILSHTHYGSERKLLIRIHNLIVLPIIDYGSIIYSTANKNLMQKLKSIHNLGIRLCIGAFRTSPVDSILAEAGEYSLEYRQEKQALNFSMKILSFEKHPILNKLVNTLIYNKFANKSLRYKPIYARLAEKLNDYNIIADKNKINHTKFQSTPPWLTSKIHSDLTLTAYKKENTSPEIYANIYREILNERYMNYQKIFTDGSVDQNKSGCAFKFGAHENKFRLQDNANICTAELYAIQKSILYAIETNHTKFLINTDSLSAIKILAQMYSVHPIAIEIKNLIYNTQKQFDLIWIPSHMGIGQNNRADKLAKEALREPVDNEFKHHYKDLNATINNLILKKWNSEWSETPLSNKLREIKTSIAKWDLIDFFPRHDSIVISRLRLGHTRLTHKYLIEKTDPPNCLCNEPLSIKHVLNNCTLYKDHRNSLKITNINNLNSHKVEDIKNIILFLKKIELYQYI